MDCKWNKNHTFILGLMLCLISHTIFLGFLNLKYLKTRLAQMVKRSLRNKRFSKDRELKQLLARILSHWKLIYN